MKKQLSLLLILTACYANSVLATGIDDLQFGPQTRTTGHAVDGIVAIVGNDVITRKEFNSLGRSHTKLDSLIMRKLLLQAAAKRNIIVGDTALNIAIDEKKRRNTNFSREKLREMLILKKLQQQVTNANVQISNHEVEAEIEQQLQSVSDKIRLVDILIRVPESANNQVLKASELKTQQVETRLKTQNGKAVASAFDGVDHNDLGWVAVSQIPSSFAKVLFDAPENQYLAPIVDRDGIHILKVLARKSSQKAHMAPLNETQVSHILVKTQDNPKAKAIIDDIYRQLKQGADFATLAKQTSQDNGSAANGGSLDWTYPGQMVADFEAVMNKTRIGTISKPFKSPFGYHILKVHDRRKSTGSKNRSQLEMRAKQAIFRKKAEETWNNWLSNLREESYVHILEK